jgi:4-amino-4-deoxy-L-arabinose transferase-like glycosyltransferase
MTYALGSLLGGRVLGVLASAVCGSTLFWLQHARLAITDAHLSLWVSVANYLFALGVLRQRWWPALAGGGAALGLAMMSKGPVALVQSVVPVLAFLAWRRWREPRIEVTDDTAGTGERRRRWLAPLAVGILIFAAVGLSWYLLVLVNRPDVWEEWKREVTREGATDLEPSKWYNYVTLFAVLMPWTLFFVAGLIDTAMTAVKGPPAGEPRRGRAVLALLLLVVPILIMSFFRDRKMRYLLPLVSPSAIIAAWGVLQLLGPAVRQRSTTGLVIALHWLPLFVAAVGLPLVGAQLVPQRFRMDGTAWYSGGFAVAAAAAFAVLVVGAVLVQRRRPLLAVAAGTAAVMLGWNVVFYTGYRHYSEGRSEIRPLAEQILASHPKGNVYSYRADRPARHAPIDLAIYLNRAVKPVADPAAPELADTLAGTRVFVVRQRHVKPVPDPSPLAPSVGGPWQFLGSTRVDEATWYAFVAGTAPQ